VHWQSVVGASGYLLADGGFGALGRGDDTGAHRGGSRVIGFVVGRGVDDIADLIVTDDPSDSEPVTCGWFTATLAPRPLCFR